MRPATGRNASATSEAMRARSRVLARRDEDRLRDDRRQARRHGHDGATRRPAIVWLVRRMPRSPDWGTRALPRPAARPRSDTAGGPTNTQLPGDQPQRRRRRADGRPFAHVRARARWTGTFPITYTYQWKRCDAADPVNGPCIDIRGRDRRAATRRRGRLRDRLRVAVSATNSRRPAHAELRSDATSSLRSHPKNTVTPPICRRHERRRPDALGRHRHVDRRRRRSRSRTRGAAAIRSATSRRCVPIAGATASTYTPTVADIGFSLRVWITGANLVGSDVTITNHTFPVVDKQHFAPCASTRADDRGRSPSGGS